ncbi:Atrial natriuretic peptide receptor 2, partial [Fragariocoptes setiger]
NMVVKKSDSSEEISTMRLMWMLAVAVSFICTSTIVGGNSTIKTANTGNSRNPDNFYVKNSVNSAGPRAWRPLKHSTRNIDLFSDENHIRRFQIKNHHNIEHNKDNVSRTGSARKRSLEQRQQHQHQHQFVASTKASEHQHAFQADNNEQRQAYTSPRGALLFHASNPQNNNVLKHYMNQQCPATEAGGASSGSTATRNTKAIRINETTGERTFTAKIMSIFSCVDQAETLDLTLDHQLAKPAIDLALARVRNTFSNINFEISYRATSDMCKHNYAVGYAAEAYHYNEANYLVGPGCSESVSSVSQLASFWNIPVCSTAYLPDAVTSKFKPITLMQLSLSVQTVGNMIMDIFRLYKWRHLVLVTDARHPLATMVRDGLLEMANTLNINHPSHVAPASINHNSNHKTSQASLFDRNYSSGFEKINSSSAGGKPSEQQQQRTSPPPLRINVTARDFNYADQPTTDYDQIVLDASLYSRVILLLGKSSTVRDILSAAHRQGMSKGQYVFIALELFEAQQFESHSSIHSEYSFEDRFETGRTGNITQDKMTREIFQPLLTISLSIRRTLEFEQFRQDVTRLTEIEFSNHLLASSLKSHYALGMASFVHDCIVLYAHLVDTILRHSNHSEIDGTNIFELATSTTFRNGISGNITLNKLGQRVMDLTLNDFSPNSLSMEPVAYYSGYERQLRFLQNKSHHWTRNNQLIPSSDPTCRHNESLCVANDDEQGYNNGVATLHTLGSDRVVIGVWLLMSIILAVSCTLTLIGWFVYRRFRIESELLNLWWAVDYSSISFDEIDVLCDNKRSMSSLAISNESFNETTTANNQRQQHQQQQGAMSSVDRLSPIQSGSVQQLPGQQIHGQEITVSAPKVGEKCGLTVTLSSSQSAGDAISTRDAQSSTLSVNGTQSAGVPSPNASTFGLAAPSGGQNARDKCKSASTNKLLPLINKSAIGTSSYRSVLTGGTGAGSQQKFATGSKSGGGKKGKENPSISSQQNKVKLRLGTVLNSTRDSTQVTRVGLYKGSRVAVKHLNIRSLNINRQLLLELRQVRDLTHENLIKFIGLCPEEPNIAIVSELCTRGNLQDLLQNDSIRLDWPFRYSIINDIVEGLIHLHSSPIGFHGRLKSSNCVIDNRFVVKLTDFGLPTLLSAIETDENINPRCLLWTAPEHLRTKHPMTSGSPKGDIYSLAIIFQEIITRCGPFECEPILCTQEVVAGGPGIASATVAASASASAAAAAAAAAAASSNNSNNNNNNFQQQSAGGTTTAAVPTTVSILSRNQQCTNHGGCLQAPPLAQSIPMSPIIVQHKQSLEPAEIVNLVRMGLSPPFRPYFRPDFGQAAAAAAAANAAATAARGTPSQAPPGGTASAGDGTDFLVADLITLVQQCWHENAALRPSIGTVKQQIKRMRRGMDGTNLMDNLLQRMERYADNLESLVEKKTAELMEEKKRSEELLYEMLPRFVVDQLKYGHSVTPEAYEAVTISFSDIKDFTSIAAQSSPIEVVNLLNQLYTEFDDTIAKFDVYKVETIGDAYMVVSGLPIRNGDNHAKEIADMSLALLDTIRNFHVAHLPEVNLELRVGMHSGPCASGVVGTRMYRYCLFGDTVNTASRMESHGEPMKIHISESSAEILRRFGTFTIEARGEVDIKGKGIMNTFWLTGKTTNEGRSRRVASARS